MQHLDNIGPAPRGQLPGAHSMNVYGGPSLVTRDGASMRMVAAMAEPFVPAGRSLFEDALAADRLTPFAAEARESDARYYRRRSKEECRAAGDATVPEARTAHQELADRYARLARRALRRGGTAPLHHRSTERARLSDLLRQRFGLSIGEPGRLPAPHAVRVMQRTEARSRV